MDIKRSECKDELIAEEERIGGIDPCAITLSASLTLSIIVFILQYLINNNALELTNFKDRTLGIAVISGVDTALRTQLYVEFILGAILLFCILFVLFNYVSKKYLKSVSVPFEKQMIFYASIFAIASTFLYVSSNWQEIFLNNLLLLYFIIILLISFVLIKVAAYYRGWMGVSDAFSREIITLSLIFPYIAYVACLTLFNMSLSFFNDGHHYFILFILWLTFIGGYYLLNRTCIGFEGHDLLVSNLIVLSFIPALLIPISIPLSNELQYTLSGMVHIEPRLLSSIIVALLLLSSLVLFVVLLKKERTKVRSARVIAELYFPIIIATATLFRYYQHLLVIGQYDMFHQGELLISNQQLFSFGSLPYIGIYPTHGLSEMYYLVLYSLANGYNPVEPLLWAWITPVIVSVLVYFILKNIIDPAFSLMAMLLVPILDLVGGYYYYAFCMLIALGLIWMLKRLTLFRSCVFWITMIFLLFWRLDFGIAALAGIIFIFSIIYAKNVFIKSLDRIGIYNLSLSFLIITILSLAIFALLATANSESIGQIILQNIQFAVYQSQVASYVAIASSYSNLAMLQYSLLPCISVIYVIYFILIVFMRQEEPYERQIILVFLAIFSLIMSIRSVQRHSLLESYNSYLFVFLLICMPFYFNFKRNLSRVLCLGLLLAYLLAIPSYTIMFNNQDGDFFDYHDWQNKEKRVHDNKSQYQDIVSFIDHSLEKNQTFFDFTNSPMLYVLADKKHIPYIIPNLYQTSDLMQNVTIEKLENYHDKGDLPVVIFKQGNWWDFVDGIPNEVRSYRIAEYIYQNYRPIGTVNQYQIWTEKNSSIVDVFRTNEIIKPINFKPKEMRSCDINRTSEDKLEFLCGNYDPQLSNFLDLASLGPLNRTAYSNLIIRYNSSLAGRLQLFFGYNGSEFGEYSCGVNLINRSCSTGNYSEVSVPLTYGKIGLTDVRFDPPDSSIFEVQSVQLDERNTPLNNIPPQDLQQDFDLKILPYIWGKYDERKASLLTKILENIRMTKTRISKDEELTLPIDPNMDKSSGNYIHIKMKSETNGNVSLSYGKGLKSSIKFRVLPTKEYEDYLIRISSQFLWMNEPIDSISIKPNEDVEIAQVLIRKGD